MDFLRLNTSISMSFWFGSNESPRKGPLQSQLIGICITLHR